MMRFGYDIAKLTICLENSFIGKIKLFIDASKIKIEDEMFNVLNNEQSLDIKAIFEQLENIELPEQTDFTVRGCDGSTWELIIDNKKYEGYLSRPEFLEKILKIIKFGDIFDYATSKLKAYTS